MKTIGILGCVWVGVLASAAGADSWITAGPQVFASEDGLASALVVPASKESPCRLHVYRESSRFAVPDKGRNIFYREEEVESWREDPARQLLWSIAMTNAISPVECFISNDGRFAVTLDNWHRVGYGDEVVAFYHAEGLIKKYDLENFAPAPKVSENNPNAALGTVSLRRSSVPMLKYMGVFSHTASSRWWRENGVEVMADLDGQCVFGVWLAWQKNWIVCDAATGQILEDTSDLLDRINQLARQKVLENLQNQSVRLSACHFLLYSRTPEDRKVIEGLLGDEHFSTGMSRVDNVLKYFEANSYVRRTADAALAIWDGVLEDFPNSGEYGYRYLGSLEGTLTLPILPGRHHSLYIYLIPQGMPEGEWAKQPFLQNLTVRFDVYDPPDRREIAFRIVGVTPGRYTVRAIFSPKKERTYRWPEGIYAGHKGDFVNAETILIDVPRGGTVKRDIVCGQRY